MGTNIWKKEDEKFISFEKDIKIPDEKLTNVKSLILKELKHFDEIPKSKGVYWIWTNEPITHVFHEPSKPLPKK